MPSCGPLPILFPALKGWGSPGGGTYVANLPTCGPLLILMRRTPGPEPLSRRMPVIRGTMLLCLSLPPN